MDEKLKTVRGVRGLGVVASAVALLASPGLFSRDALAQTNESARAERTEDETALGAERAVLEIITDTNIQVDDRSGQNGDELGGASFRSGAKLYIVSAHIDPETREIETAIQRCDADLEEIRGGHGRCGQNQNGFEAVRMGAHGVSELRVLRVRDENGHSTFVFSSPEDPEWNAEAWAHTLREMRDDIERYIADQRQPRI